MTDILSLVFKNPVVAFVALVGIVVFIHELGHYLVGVFFKLEIDEFSLGFGPKAFGFKKGRTEYKVCWLPLGGFVRFASPDQNDVGMTVNPELFLPTAKLYKRFLVSVAGPFANFILSLVVMIGLAKNGLPAPDALISVMPDSPAERAGLLTGDRIKKIKGETVRSWSEINKNVSANPEIPLEISVERPGEKELVTLIVTPMADFGESLFGEKQKIGRIGVSQFFSSPTVVFTGDSLFSTLNLKSPLKILAVNGKPVSMRNEIVSALSSYFNECKNLLDSSCQVELLAEDFKAQNLNDIKPTQQKILIPGKLVSEILQQKNLLEKNSISEFWKKEIISTDLTISAAEQLKKGDNRIEVRDGWSACGIEPGFTIIGHKGLSTFAPQDSFLETNTGKKGEGASEMRQEKGNFVAWQDPMGLAALLTKINLELRDSARNGKTGSEVVPLNLRGFGADGSGIKELNCTIPTREAMGPDGRMSPFLDFPFSFQTNGVPVKPVTLVSETFADAIADGSAAALNQGLMIFNGLKKLVTGSLPLSNLGGPIAIAKVAQDAAEGGILLFLLTISGMSMNIGIFNLLPLPALDGGAILLQIIEALYGKPPSVKVQNIIQKAGVVVIFTLFLVVFYNDIFRLIKS